MFKKKTCNGCGKKFNSEFDYCPYCGASSGDSKKSKDGNWGMLGKDDQTSPFDELTMPSGFNMLFNSLFKNLEKQFNDLEKQNKNFKSSNPKVGGINISISTSGNKPPVIRVNKKGIGENMKAKRLPSGHFSSDKLKKYSKLPREEAKANVRRLSNRVIYEIEMPGVDSIEDVSILKLESSMEIKAVSDKKAYYKSISMNSPVDYNFSAGKLVLEFASE